ncbi:MAG: hypothetical protein KatS3mg040_0015 [Candidatus Kapaibacterium sp.]|nr:MAG: hypothetical protein KatS3mg040_0015 [Candidatus Kapabacteria bacterium]
MTYDPEQHHRRSIRLPGYDYVQAGGYFITICTHDRTNMFGEVVDGEMQVNAVGEVVCEEWFRTAQIRPYVRLYDDEFVVMPNHIHGIIWIINDDVGATRRVAPTRRVAHRVGATHRVAPTDPPRGPASGSIGAIVGQFKSITTKRINALRGTPGAPVWQRNYYEHIIRTEDALQRIRQYIVTNPLRWLLDRENPDRTGRNPDEEMWFGTI